MTSAVQERPVVSLCMSTQCKLEYCDKTTHLQGYCQGHYVQIHRYKIEPRPLNGTRHGQCIAPWCDTPMHGDKVLCVKCSKRRRRYGMTVDEYCAITQECESCGGSDRIHIDHNHETGKVRGILCQGCNQALGLLRNDPTVIEKLAHYARTRQ